MGRNALDCGDSQALCPAQLLAMPGNHGGCIAGEWLGSNLEDDLPGGFNDPDGKRTPRYAIITWVVRAVGVALLLLLLLILGLSFFRSR
jgi:hypothetical protein